LHRFGDIAGFVLLTPEILQVLCFWPYPYSTLIMGC